MFSRCEWMISLRYLRARRQEGFISVVAWLSVIGIALGVGTLIVVLAVMNGFRHDILSRILGFNGHITVYAGPAGLVTDPALIDVISGVSGVVRVNALVQGQVIVTANGVTRGAFVRGMQREDLVAKELVAGNIRSGSLEDFDTAGGMVIGQRLAEAMGLRVGDSLTAISPRGNVTAFGTMPRVLSYRVDAIFEAGMTDFDEAVIFLPLAAAQTYFKLGDRVTTLEIFVDDPTRADAVAREVRRVVGDAYQVLDWQRSQSALVNALKVERNVLSLILTMIIIVAAFNIISGLVILVKDKAADIAILRTMGATRGMILRVFFLSGASIGVTGTLLGFGLGLAFAANIEALRQLLQRLIGTELFSPEIYFLSQMPSRVDPAEVAVVVAVGLALSFLATLYPSWRAARIDPVEALRYE